MKKAEKTVNKRQLEGTVVSSKMQKTVVVRVDRVKVHPKYEKRYVVSKKYKAHDEKGIAKDGMVVVIEACRPISRDKRFRVVRIVNKSK
jgi:small subunit ribosomal protein S17